MLFSAPGRRCQWQTGERRADACTAPLPCPCRDTCDVRAAVHADHEARFVEAMRDVRHSEGNHQSYIEALKRRTGADADQPQRIAYGKLVRA